MTSTSLQFCLTFHPKELRTICGALFFAPAVHHSFVDVEEDSIDVLCLVENLHMVRETNTKEIVTVDIGRHWRPVYEARMSLLV